MHLQIINNKNILKDHITLLAYFSNLFTFHASFLLIYGPIIHVQFLVRKIVLPFAPYLTYNKESGNKSVCFILKFSTILVNIYMHEYMKNFDTFNVISRKSRRVKRESSKENETSAGN